MRHADPGNNILTNEERMAALKRVDRTYHPPSLRDGREDATGQLSLQDLAVANFSTTVSTGRSQDLCLKVI